MPSYSYQAIDQSNKKKKAVIEAESERRARQKISAEGLSLIRIKRISVKERQKERISAKHLILTTRQISLLLDSDTQVEESLKIAADQSKSRIMKETLYQIREQVLEGKSLKQAFSEFPKIFDHTYLSLIQAGDFSGNLMVMFDSLAEYLEENLAIKRKVLAALIYPLIVFLFSIFSILLFFVVVLPKVVEQFESAGVQLPFITQVFISLSKIIPLFVLFLLLLALIGLVYLKFKPLSLHQRSRVDFYLMKIPLLGSFLMLVELERFSALMFLYIKAGINFDIAFMDTVKSFKNFYLKQTFKSVVMQVREGKDFVVSLKKLSFCPMMFTEILGSGYKSGNMQKAFLKLNSFLKLEIENKRNLFLATLEPFIILMMGALILVLVVSIILPILKMNTLLLN